MPLTNHEEIAMPSLSFSRALAHLAAALMLATGLAHADAPPTLRVDYIHSGTTKAESYALERVVIEPLPWPGNPAEALDPTNLGANKVEVVDAASGTLIRQTTPGTTSVVTSLPVAAGINGFGAYWQGSATPGPNFTGMLVLTLTVQQGEVVTPVTTYVVPQVYQN